VGSLGEQSGVSGGRPLLSAVVVAQNAEENQLVECLKALSFCDEIVVVLDRCTDQALDAARRFTTRVVEGAWEHEGRRHRAGLDAAQGVWVLEVDADEHVSPGLADEIRRVVAHSTVSWHQIPVDHYVGERLLRHGWDPLFARASFAGLYRHGAKRWSDQRVRPEVILSGSQGPTLQARLVHHVGSNISELLAQLDCHTTARAADLRESGRIGGLRGNVRRGLGRFWNCYIARRGYREGPYGFLIALLAGLYPVLSYLKARLEKE
jgi:hypothetical protein